MVQLPASAKVVVPAPLLTTNAAIVLPVKVNVPVPTAVTPNAVYVPPVLNVNVFTFNVATAAGVVELPVKLNVLNHEPVVKVGILAPEVNDRFGALAVLPSTLLPKLNVLVTVIAEENPPVPV